MQQKKKDNSTASQKIALRLNALREIDDPIVMETHGGYGLLWSRCYRHVERGVVFETDADKAEALARQRPGWSVYESDSTPSIAAGVGFHLPVNFFDVDPYGASWEVIDAIFAGMNHGPVKIALVVHDALMNWLRRGHSTDSKSDVCTEITMQYGRDCAFDRYGDFSRNRVSCTAKSYGYRLHKWTIFFGGRQQDNTHFAAILSKE